MIDPGPLLAALVIILTTQGGALLLAKREGVLSPALTGLALHYVVAAVMYFNFGLWSGDAALYDRLGQSYAEVWFQSSDRAPTITVGKEGFPAVLGVIYGAGGHHPYLGILFNIGLAVACIPLLTKAARRLSLPGVPTAWLVATFPPALLWGSLLLRESLSWFLLSLIVLGLAGVTTPDAEHSEGAADWAMILLGLTGLLYVRGTAAALIAAAVLFTAAASARNRLWPTLLGGIAAIVGGASLARPFTSVVGGYDIESVNQVRGSLAREATSSFEVTQFSGIGSIVVNSPMLLARGLLGPFPWEYPRIGAIFSADGLIWLSLLYLVFQGVRATDRFRPLLAFIVPAATLVIVLSITSGNYGTLTRLRDQAALILMPLAGMGWVALRKRRAANAARQRLVPPRRPQRPSTASEGKDHGRLGERYARHSAGSAEPVSQQQDRWSPDYRPERR